MRTVSFLFIKVTKIKKKENLHAVQGAAGTADHAADVPWILFQRWEKIRSMAVNDVSTYSIEENKKGVPDRRNILFEVFLYVLFI